jgi:hypothetical protein
MEIHAPAVYRTVENNVNMTMRQLSDVSVALERDIASRDQRASIDLPQMYGHEMVLGAMITDCDYCLGKYYRL